MSNVHGVECDEPCLELRLKFELVKCTGHCASAALSWLVLGGAIPGITLYYLPKHGFLTYLPFHTKCLITSVSAIVMSYSMCYFSKIKCEENIIKLFAEHREKELEEKKDLQKISRLKRLLLSLS